MQMERLVNRDLKTAKEFAKILGRASIVPLGLVSSACNNTTPFVPDQCVAKIEIRRTGSSDQATSTLFNIPIPCHQDTNILLNPNKIPQVNTDSWLRLTRDMFFSPVGAWIALMLAGGLATGFARSFRR